MQAHLVFVAAAGSLGELAGLICVESLFNIVDFYDEIFFLGSAGVTCPSSAAGRGGAGCVDRTPCRWLRM